MGQFQTLAPFPDPFVSSVVETPIGGAQPLGISTSTAGGSLSCAPALRAVEGLDANGISGQAPYLNKLRTPLTPTPSPSI